AIGISLVLLTPDWGQAFAALGAALLVVLAAGFYLFRTQPGRIAWLGLFLRESQASERGYTDSRPAEDHVGKSGPARPPLRPAGIVRIDGRRYDVVSEGGYIESGRPVRVVAEEGMRLVLREDAEDGGGVDGDGGGRGAP